MAISLSNTTLEALGFRQLSETESISARFHLLRIYQVRGFALDEPSLSPMIGSIAGHLYQLALGASVNAVCRALVDADLTDNEQEWQKEHRSSPPYLAVHLGPTGEHRFAGTHAKLNEPTIRTYDGFGQAHAELRAWEEDVLPSLLTGLAASFSPHKDPVKFLPTDHTLYGITNDNRTVVDMQFSFSALCFASTRIPADEAGERLASAINIASRIRKNVARFYHLALNEDDPLKRFLYFFLAIEIETHATFSRINDAQHISALLVPPPHAPKTGQCFFSSQMQRLRQSTNLGDRFEWCVLCVWSQLSDSDAQDFRRLKKIRNDIAHGSSSTPPADAVSLVEKLATKLQLPTP